MYASLAGVGVGTGLVMALFWFLGVRMTVDNRGVVKQWVQDGGYRLLAAVIVLVILLVATRIVALSCAIAALIAFWPQLFGAKKQAQHQIRVLEALANWTEAMRDTIASGSGMLEALRATTSRPPEDLAVQLGDTAARLYNREPLEDCLRTLAEDIDDVIADQVLAALILNARSQGRQLQAVLTGLAESTRSVVQARREVEAERQKMRRAVQIIAGCIAVLLAGMLLFGGDFVAAYKTFGGQIAMCVVMGLFAAGFLVMRQLAIIRTADRFLRRGNA